MNTYTITALEYLLTIANAEDSISDWFADLPPVMAAFATTALAIELETEACSLDCAGRLSFVSENFVSRIDLSSLNLADAQKASIDGGICSLQCETFSEFLKCINEELTADNY
jgi:hypothetical protein